MCTLGVVGTVICFCFHPFNFCMKAFFRNFVLKFAFERNLAELLLVVLLLLSLQLLLLCVVIVGIRLKSRSLQK